MDIEALHDAIYADPTAKALADAGDDAGAAASIAPSLPKIVSRRMIDASNILEAFTDPADGVTVLGALKTVADATDSDPLTPILAAMMPFLTTPGSYGVNVGSAKVRATLDALETAQSLTSDQVATVKALAEATPIVTADDVSAAWAQYRPDGRIPA